MTLQNKDEFEGSAKTIEGNLKETFGQITNDAELDLKAKPIS